MQEANANYSKTKWSENLRPHSASYPREILERKDLGVKYQSAKLRIENERNHPMLSVAHQNQHRAKGGQALAQIHHHAKSKPSRPWIRVCCSGGQHDVFLGEHPRRPDWNRRQ